jgi:hypothetical protein
MARRTRQSDLLRSWWSVTLRVRRYRRLTQHSLPGDLLGLTWAGLAPADRASFAWRLPLLNHLTGAVGRLARSSPERLDGIPIAPDTAICFGTLDVPPCPATHEFVSTISDDP